MEKEDSSPLDAAYRELKEEADIKKDDVIRVLDNVHYFVIDEHYLTGEPITPIHEYVFGFELKQGISIRIDKNIYPEHEEFTWVPFNTAIELLKWENNKDGFKRLYGKLCKEKKILEMAHNWKKTIQNNEKSLFFLTRNVFL